MAAKQKKVNPAGGHPPQPDNPQALARVRAACAGLPGVVEKIAWGGPTFRTGDTAGDRMFASFVVDHHRDGRTAVWCAAPPGMQALLMETAPDRTFVPPYVGHQGWIGLDLAHTDDAQLAHHLHAAWRKVAPKKRLALLEPD